MIGKHGFAMALAGRKSFCVSNGWNTGATSVLASGLGLSSIPFGSRIQRPLAFSAEP